MKASIFQDIGNHFKKENIFLGIFLPSKKSKQKELREQLGEEVLGKSEVVEKLAREELINSSLVDIFYKDEKGYIRFSKDGIEIFAGDNSDRKGRFKKLESIWCYYSEDDVKEVLVNDSFMAIAVTNYLPLNRFVFGTDKS